jgi:uncharacterized protein
MTSPHSEQIDVGVLAAQHSTVKREFPLECFERLADRLVRPEGRVRVELHYTEAGEFPGLEGVLLANPWLVCQRCLEPFEARVESPVRVALVANDPDADRVPEDFEPVQTQSGWFDLHEMVEDELLLALPLVPLHETAAGCATARVALPESEAEPVKAPVHRPFGDLRELMKR